MKSRGIFNGDVLEHNLFLILSVSSHKLMPSRICLATTLYLICMLDSVYRLFWQENKQLFNWMRTGQAWFLFLKHTGVNMMAGLRCCPIISWMALAAVLGSVLGLGEDLDRPLFGPPGSPLRLQESDPGLKKALQFAEERYNLGSNAMHLRRVSRLVSATKQVT